MIQRVSLQERLGSVSTLASFNGMRINARIVPCDRGKCSGDWCEAFPVSDTVIALSIGDVCGHGEAVVETMERCRSAIRAGVLAGRDPAETLTDVNRLVFAIAPFTYATAVLAFVDTQQNVATFANAGHPPPLLVMPSGARFIGNSRADLPLGVVADTRPALQTFAMGAETLLVLYTDGVTEHDRLPLLGEAELRLAATFAYHSSLPSAGVIFEQMELESATRDDIALMTASTTPRRPRLSRIAGRTLAER